MLIATIVNYLSFGFEIPFIFGEDVAEFGEGGLWCHVGTGDDTSLQEGRTSFVNGRYGAVAALRRVDDEDTVGRRAA